MVSQTHQSQARKVRDSEQSGKAERGDILRETIDELKERSDDVKAMVLEYVHQKPFKSLGIAVLTGMALALILKR